MSVLNTTYGISYDFLLEVWMFALDGLREDTRYFRSVSNRPNIGRGERRFKSNRANFEDAKTKDQKNEEKQHDWFTTRQRAVRSSHVKQVPGKDEMETRLYIF